MNIGVDLDGVVAAWLDRFIEFYNLTYGKAIKKSDFVGYNIWECDLGLSKEEGWRVMDEFYNSDDFDSIQLIEGVKDGFLKLAKQDNLFLITSRTLNTKSKTDKFLDRYLSDIPIEIYYSRAFNRNDNFSGKLKSEICEELGINYFVEDCLDYARDCARVCKRVFLLDNPWNQEQVSGNITRVNNWREIVELIQKENIGGKEDAN